MKNQTINATLLFYPRNNPKVRLFALWYFTVLMIVWNLLGHTLLGFEQSWATPVTAVLTAVAVSMLLDWVDARARHRELRFTASLGSFLNFLPACFIPGFACGMLLYANERLAPLIFAVTLSIASIMTGIIVHGLFTGRLPLVAAWVGGFILQGIVRAKLFGTPLVVPLLPMTSAAFIILTLYMIPDPATTPLNPTRQAWFGFSVALVYATLQMLHLVFGLFFALLIVCAIRGLSLQGSVWLNKLRPEMDSLWLPLRSGTKRASG